MDERVMAMRAAEAQALRRWTETIAANGYVFDVDGRYATESEREQARRLNKAIERKYPLSAFLDADDGPSDLS